MSEIYVSVDVETDGPIPGRNSMLSVGAYAFRWDKPTKAFVDLGTYSVNLLELPGATPDPDTQEWWRGRPEAWAKLQVNRREPDEATAEFDAWVRSLGGKPVCVAFPAGFDFTFLYWYLVSHLGPGKSPFSFSCLDIKSYAMAVLGESYRDCTKRLLKPFIPDNLPHTHIAVEDALEQGKMFQNLYLCNAGLV